MNCKASQDYMMKYFDGCGNDIESAQFKQHLKTCKNCSEEFENLNEAFNFLTQDNGVEPPLDFEANVMKKIDSMEMVRRKRTERTLILLYWAATLALGALFALFVLDAKEAILHSVSRAGNGSVLANALYHVLNVFYGLVDKSFDFLLQLGIIVNNLYRYIVAAAALLLLAARTDLAGLGRKMKLKESRSGLK
ncbi:MAG: zf-HC2 domain-containing protein [Clostridiales bacterium]|jgi:hypothetical protein|nr:zf-HC2 domain-containing protein [Eubacteriales bacterium]MDH7566915.1 zf-HC2 domain-containing protein [Clostridiales bacterium]